MKKIANLLFVILLTVAIQVQSQDREPYITKSFSSESVKEVYARTSGGSVDVEGGSSQARVEVFIQGNNGRSLSKDDIKERLEEDYKLEITVVGGELKVVAEPKDKFFNWKNALNISFKISVPQQVSTDISTSGGSISMPVTWGPSRGTGLRSYATAETMCWSYCTMAVPPRASMTQDSPTSTRSKRTSTSGSSVAPSSPIRTDCWKALASSCAM